MIRFIKGTGCIPIGIVLLALCAGHVQGQGTTTRPTPPEVEAFLVMSTPEFDARLRSWTKYDIMHVDREQRVDREQAKVELLDARHAGFVYIYQCGPSAEIQQQTAREFAALVNGYVYWALRYNSNDKPPEGGLLWQGNDNPFLNHARRMRDICGATPIFAQLHTIISGRPVLLEEVQWQFVAAAGCGYRGVLWPVTYGDVTWGEELKQIEEKIGKYARFLAQAQPVGWAKADNDQPISVLACDGYLFVFLLNPAYMTLGVDGRTVPAPLNRPACQGTVTLTLPRGLKVRRGQVLLGTMAPSLKAEGGKTTAQYSFKTGGEMLIFTLGGKIEPGATAQLTESTTRPATTQPVTVENEK